MKEKLEVAQGEKATGKAKSIISKGAFKALQAV